MKFYHVDNKGKNSKSHWLIAKDEKDAIRIASTQPGKPTNVRELKPEKNIQNLLDDGKTGLLAMSLGKITPGFPIGNMNNQKPLKDPWFLYEEI